VKRYDQYIKSKIHWIINPFHYNSFLEKPSFNHFRTFSNTDSFDIQIIVNELNHIDSETYSKKNMVDITNRILDISRQKIYDPDGNNILHYLTMIIMFLSEKNYFTNINHDLFKSEPDNIKAIDQRLKILFDSIISLAGEKPYLVNEQNKLGRTPVDNLVFRKCLSDEIKIHSSLDGYNLDLIAVMSHILNDQEKQRIQEKIEEKMKALNTRCNNFITEQLKFNDILEILSNSGAVWAYNQDHFCVQTGLTDIFYNISELNEYNALEIIRGFSPIQAKKAMGDCPDEAQLCLS